MYPWNLWEALHDLDRRVRALEQGQNTKIEQLLAEILKEVRKQ